MNVTHESVDLGPFEFECGESIPNLQVAYETYGDSSNPPVLVCHALTGSQHVAGRDPEGETSGQAAAWWDDVVGPGKAVDTGEYFVICANVPGSCYGTTGPASENPETGEPHGPDFPAVTVGDWTRAQRRLLDELGIERLRAVVGGSVGGMNVLEWARQFPDDVDLVVPVATAASLDPQCLALDAIARRAITADPNWNGGDYYGPDRPDPDHGLALARQIGHVMYLSKDSMDRKFGRRTAGREAGGSPLAPEDPAASFFPYRDVESYLDYQAETFVERFDANSYLLLTRAMDDYDLARGCRSPAHALAEFDGEALVISFTGDWHFTVEQADDLATAFRTADVPTAHRVVESDHGHDAFLVEPETFGPALADFLAEGVTGEAVADARLPPNREDYAPVHTSLFSQ